MSENSEKSNDVGATGHNTTPAIQSVAPTLARLLLVTIRTGDTPEWALSAASCAATIDRCGAELERECSLYREARSVAAPYANEEGPY